MFKAVRWIKPKGAETKRCWISVSVEINLLRFVFAEHNAQIYSNIYSNNFSLAKE